MLVLQRKAFYMGPHEFNFFTEFGTLGNIAALELGARLLAVTRTLAKVGWREAVSP